MRAATSTPRSNLRRSAIQPPTRRPARDGAQVEKGAVADVLRRGNNPPYADATTTPSPASVNRAMLTCKNDNTSTTFNNSLVTCNTGTTALHALSSTNIADPDALLAADNTERDRIINFARGEDFSSDQTDLNQNGSTTDVRPDVHGDVAHSRPLPLNYGGSTGVVLFYGSNDATFRAVRGSDGKELWAFVAPEHHQKLKRMRDNLPLIKYPNSTDPSHMARDYFFDGTAGAYQTFNSDNTSNTAWIFPSMRRGGRMLYGFNVSDPSNPRMLWRAGCPVNSASDDTGCTTGFSGIGQTWSTPLAAKILGYSSGADPVVIVGGGYDSCEDNDAATTTCSSPKGRNVYVLNASTGAIIKTFGTGGTGTIDRSVAADIALVDRSFTGYAQHAYVSDVGGNLYRIDFVDPATRAARAPADWTITKIARTSGGNRKFLFAPAVLPSNGKVYLTIGTGDRERPLITNYPYVESVQNRFYMFASSAEFMGGFPPAERF